MNKPPCYKCTEREERGLTCHDNCNEFLEYRKKIDEYKIKKARESEAIGYAVDNVHRFRKSKNLPQYR